MQLIWSITLTLDTHMNLVKPWPIYPSYTNTLIRKCKPNIYIARIQPTPPHHLTTTPPHRKMIPPPLNPTTKTHTATHQPHHTSPHLAPYYPHISFSAFIYINRAYLLCMRMRTYIHILMHATRLPHLPKHTHARTNTHHRMHTF